MAVTESDVTRRAALEALRAIEADLGVTNILRELDELPYQIRAQQEAVRAARQAVDEAKTQVDNAEALIAGIIGSETDARTGKPAFSNDTARKAELVRRKTTDEEYLAASKRLAEAEAAAADAQFELDLLHNRFSALRAAAGITDKRLAILGGI